MAISLAVFISSSGNLHIIKLFFKNLLLVLTLCRGMEALLHNSQKGKAEWSLTEWAQNSISSMAPIR